ncbi:hypothetical protein DO021_21395 [Desulfobacter hydrogenophilus]|uniref:Uncharacterized protein n=1 Tax=Desulfobacter hydrogenophilus TaxID=2291 RepID=A0A328FAE7_9BACT|nr:hypothetical protein DO021_21395 [Desulfobacter hydrogenophilus]
MVQILVPLITYLLLAIHCYSMIKFFLTPCNYWGVNDVFLQAFFIKSHNLLILFDLKNYATNMIYLIKTNNISILKKP